MTKWGQTSVPYLPYHPHASLSFYIFWRLVISAPLILNNNLYIIFDVKILTTLRKGQVQELSAQVISDPPPDLGELRGGLRKNFNFWLWGLWTAPKGNIIIIFQAEWQLQGFLPHWNANHNTQVKNISYRCLKLKVIWRPITIIFDIHFTFNQKKLNWIFKHIEYYAWCY